MSALDAAQGDALDEVFLGEGVGQQDGRGTHHGNAVFYQVAGHIDHGVGLGRVCDDLGCVVIDEQLPHEKLQGPQVPRPGQVDRCRVPAVPLHDDGEHGDDRQSWLHHGQKDPEQDGHGRSAIQLGSLLIAGRELVEGGLHDDDIVGVHESGDHDGPAGVQKTEVAYQHIGGDGARVENHGEHDKQGNGLGQLEALPGDQIARQRGQDRAGNCGEQHVNDGIQVACPDLLVLEDHLVALQGDLAQGLEKQAGGCHQQPGVADGGHDHVPDRQDAG